MQLLPGWTKLRVYNSEDPPEAEQQGICQTQMIDYTELRIASQNWASAFFESWILQIVLSEMMDVPTTIETGDPDAGLNFYVLTSPFDYGVSNDLAALQLADQIGDCRLASCDPIHDQSCAHFIPEYWEKRQEAHSQLTEFVRNGVLEPPQRLGVLGEKLLFIPKFTGLQDPTVMNYMGLQGEENRRKLAFLRPATWKQYCDQVSTNNCSENDGIAAWPLQNESEYERMFVQGLYTGQFRATDKNDCSLNLLNCTGHVADFPCG